MRSVDHGLAVLLDSVPKNEFVKAMVPYVAQYNLSDKPAMPRDRNRNDCPGRRLNRRGDT